jgi:hypothetical protein
VCDQLRCAADVGRDDRKSGRRSLEEYLAEGLRRAGEAEEVGAGVGGRQLLAVQLAEEAHTVRGGCLELRPCGAVADNGEPQAGMPAVGSRER